MSDMPGLLRAYLALDKRRKAGGLSPAEMARWSQLKSALNRHFQPDLDEQHEKKRESVRVPLSLNVNFESRGEVRKFATESPLPIGTPFNVRIRIEKTGEEVELPGEVVTVGVSADLSQKEHGMGVRFVNLTEAQRQQVIDFSEEAMMKAIEDPPDEPPEEP